MPKTKISEYSQTAANNTDINSINLAEGMLPSDVNNALRELMKQLKDFQVGASGDAFTFAGGVLISGTPNTISGATNITGNATFSSGTLKLAGSSSGTATLNPPAAASTYTYTMPAATTDIAGLAVAQTFSASQRGTVTTDNDGSFDLSVTNNFQCTPTGTFALTFTNRTAGQSGYILLINTGGHAITAHADTLVQTGALTAISAAGTYILNYFATSSKVYVTHSGAMA